MKTEDRAALDRLEAKRVQQESTAAPERRYRKGILARKVLRASILSEAILIQLNQNRRGAHPSATAAATVQPTNRFLI